MQGKTKSGFEYSIDDRILSDWRFTMALTKCQKSDGIKQLEGAQDMVRLMLGDEGLEMFMNHIAEHHDGFVPADVVMSEIKEIFENAIPKN